MGPPLRVYQAPLPMGGRVWAGRDPSRGWGVGRSGTSGWLRLGPARPVPLVSWGRAPALSAGRPQVPPVKVRSHMPVSFGVGGTPLPLWWSRTRAPSLPFPSDPFSEPLLVGLHGCPCPPPLPHKAQECPHPGEECSLPDVPGTLRLGLVPFFWGGGVSTLHKLAVSEGGVPGRLSQNCAASTSNSTLSSPKKHPWALLAVPPTPHPSDPSLRSVCRLARSGRFLQPEPCGVRLRAHLGQFGEMLPPSLLKYFPACFSLWLPPPRLPPLPLRPSPPSSGLCPAVPSPGFAPHWPLCVPGAALR